VYPVHPHVDVIHSREVALLERLALFLPSLGEAGYARRREPGPGAEELLQGRREVPGGEPVQVQQRQDLRNLRGAAHVRRQDDALEPLSLAGSLIHSLVVDPRSLNLDGAGPAEDLAFVVVAVPDDEGVPGVLVALAFGGL
jgi:hypothetical protein